MRILSASESREVSGRRSARAEVLRIVWALALTIGWRVLGASSVWAQETPLPTASPASKSAYSLFNPTPREKMRPLWADRPDKTESPYTVDAGHFQIETDLVAYTRDRKSEASDASAFQESVNLNAINLKAGLTSNVDLQWIVEMARWARNYDEASAQSGRWGLGDVTPRLKINFFGNDGGLVSLGLIAYVTFPTRFDRSSSNRAATLGVSLPIAFDLPGEAYVGAMVTHARVLGGAGEWSSMITTGNQVVGDLAGYLEFFNTVSEVSAAPWIATVDAGLTWSYSPDLVFDAGVNVGVTAAADDLNPFLGVTARF